MRRCEDCTVGGTVVYLAGREERVLCLWYACADVSTGAEWRDEPFWGTKEVRRCRVVIGWKTTEWEYKLSGIISSKVPQTSTSELSYNSWDWGDQEKSRWPAGNPRAGLTAAVDLYPVVCLGSMPVAVSARKLTWGLFMCPWAAELFSGYSQPVESTASPNTANLARGSLCIRF